MGRKLNRREPTAFRRTRFDGVRNRRAPSERVHFAGCLADNKNVIIININVAAVLSSGADAFFRKTGRFASVFSNFSRRVEPGGSTLRTILTVG